MHSKFLLFLAVITFSGCALFYPAYRTDVDIVNDRRQVEDCESRGTVRGSAHDWEDDENSVAIKAVDATIARHDMKYEAYQRNANTILITSINVRGHSTTITGEAFFCDN